MKTPAAWAGWGLLVLGLGLAWIDPALLADVRSIGVPLTGGFARMGKIVLFSYGSLSLLAFIVAVAGAVFRRPIIARLAAAALLLLVFLLPLQIAFLKPAWLRALVNEHDEYRRIYSFANAALPLNRGLEPTFDPNLELASIPDRFTSACSFLGQGWTVTGLGAAILFIVAGAQLSARPRRATLALLGVASVAMTASVLPRPIAAERAMRRALVLDARGDSSGARAACAQAIASDGWYRSGPFVYRQIGELDDRAGRRDTAEYWLYAATQAENDGLLHDAVFDYQRAAQLGAFGEVAQREAARASAVEGAQLFQAGMPGEAVAAWERAQQFADRQLLARFGVARGYHALADYGHAVETNLALLKLFKNSLVLANVHANLADDYEKLGQREEARRHYNIAQALDNDRNFRAYNSLAGQ